MEDNERINILTLQQTAELLSLPGHKVLHMAKNKKLPAFKVGGRWRISESELTKWIQMRNEH